jgi:hypothetical protein
MCELSTIEVEKGVHCHMNCKKFKTLKTVVETANMKIQESTC